MLCSYFIGAKKIENDIIQNGATGSRLISGNHSLYQIAETFIAQFHDAESALIFNSGYDANVGFFSALPQRNDVILYDELSHASIRDGIVMSNAKSYKFNHNDFEDLAYTNNSIYFIGGYRDSLFVTTSSGPEIITSQGQNDGVFGDMNMNGEI